MNFIRDENYSTQDELASLRALNAELIDALRRISFAEPDRLDHALDCAIILRAAKIAKAALAKATK